MGFVFLSSFKIYIFITQHCLSKLRMNRETDQQRHPIVLLPGNIKVAQGMGLVDVTFWPQSLFCGLLVRKWGGSLVPPVSQAQTKAQEYEAAWGGGQGHKLGTGWQELGKSDCYRPSAGWGTRPGYSVCGLNKLTVQDSQGNMVSQADHRRKSAGCI